MNQKLHSNLKIHSVTTSKVHLTTNSANENSVHALRRPTIDHRPEFQQLVHSVTHQKPNDLDLQL